MYPPNHKAGQSKQESFRVFGGFGDPSPFRMKSTQLPTPPSRLHFTFTPEPQQKPTRSGNEQDRKTSVSIAATEIQDPSDLKKGYGFEYPEETAEECVDIFSSGSASTPRGFAWVGVRKPEGHFEKVFQENRPDPAAESQPTTPTHGIEHNHSRRPIAIPRRLRKPKTERAIACLSGNKNTSKSCQTGPFSAAREGFSKPPAPSVEDVADEEEARSDVEQKPVNSHHGQSDSQTTESVLPSPPPTPPPQAGPSASTKPTQPSATATTDDRLHVDNMSSSNDSDTDSGDESDLEVSRLHSWNWPVVSKSGNFECPQLAYADRITRGAPAVAFCFPVAGADEGNGNCSAGGDDSGDLDAITGAEEVEAAAFCSSPG
ncbi:hypothetical protein BC567DRAFT_263800 [Phyllosticta citribraziliensis]